MGGRYARGWGGVGVGGFYKEAGETACMAGGKQASKHTFGEGRGKEGCSNCAHASLCTRALACYQAPGAGPVCADHRGRASFSTDPRAKYQRGTPGCLMLPYVHTHPRTCQLTYPASTHTPLPTPPPAKKASLTRTRASTHGSGCRSSPPASPARTPPPSCPGS